MLPWERASICTLHFKRNVENKHCHLVVFTQLLVMVACRQLEAIQMPEMRLATIKPQ